MRFLVRDVYRVTLIRVVLINVAFAWISNYKLLSGAVIFKPLKATNALTVPVIFSEGKPNKPL